MSFYNGHTTIKASRKCSLKKNNLRKDFQRLSSYKEQQGENYKYQGMNLKPRFPNILCIFEHFRNNKLKSYLLIYQYSIIVIDNKDQ